MGLIVFVVGPIVALVIVLVIAEVWCAKQPDGIMTRAVQRSAREAEQFLIGGIVMPVLGFISSAVMFWLFIKLVELLP